MKRIEQRLREAMGLDANSIGSSSIQRTVRLRMKAHGLDRLEDYIALLDKSAPEREELIESVVIAETWFFRDAESFCALVRVIKEQWLPANPTSQLRILSVPCSSGEEPYSVAMALLEAGLPPQRFRIDAADISERALTRAREGVYGKNSFRGKNLGFRDRYFHKTNDGLMLDSTIRSRVSFFPGNIISKDFPARGIYDVIFCRNLLIYFDRPTQHQAITQLNRLLVTNGVLFVGPAELPLISEVGFASLGIPLAFASRKCSAMSPVAQSGPNRSNPAPPQSTVTASSPWVTMHEHELAAAKPTREASDDLQAVRRLADMGNLKGAGEICEAYLRGHADSPQAWYLLGLIRDAAGEKGAIECYRKALYLDPEHYETLLQMALLAERDGNAPSARTFRSRADRLKTKTLGVA
jgi:chemotaxis protein methyltransferase WspC